MAPNPHPRLASVVVALVAAVSVVSAGATAAGASTSGTATVVSTVSDLIDVVTYKVHTVRGHADGTTTDKTTPGVVLVPTPVDVDRSVVPLPDLTVMVTVLPTPSPRIRIDIQRLTLNKLPVLVEAVFDLPGGTQGVAFGYDGRADTAPSRFTTTVTFDKGAATDVNMSMTTSGAGTTLALVGALFTKGAGGARVDPTDVSVGLTPVPKSLTAHALLDSAAGRTRADLATPHPTLTDVRLSDRRPGSDLGVAATIDRLPSALSLDVAGRPDTHHQELRYTASAPIASITAAFHHDQRGEQTLVDATVGGLPSGFALTADSPPIGAQTANWSAEGRLGSLDVNVRQLTDGALTSQIVAKASDLSPVLSFTKDGSRVTFNADSPIGALEAGLASPGPVVLATDEPADYLKVTDTSSAARVLGLQSFTAETGDPLILTAAVAPVALHADITRRGVHVDATLDRLPAQLRKLSFSAGQGVVEYKASDPIHRISVDVTSDQPLVGRATRAHLTLRGIPTDLLLDFGNKAPRTTISTRATECQVGNNLPDCEPPGGGGGGDDDGDDGGDEGEQPAPPDASTNQRILLDANGASVGSAELLLTSGPSTPAEPLTPAQDGVVAEDLAEHFLVQARITGLRRAHLELVVDDKRAVPGGKFLFTRLTGDLLVDPAVNGGRAVVADLRHQQGLRPTGEIDRIHAFVTNLPEHVSLQFTDSQKFSFVPNQKVTTATYTASTAITRVTLDADVPGLPNPVFLAVENVPTFMELCKASDKTCGELEADDGGSFRFRADSPVRLSAFICQNPAPCTHDEPSAMTDGLILRDVTVKDLIFELNLGDLSKENPFRLRFDTKGSPITGNVVLLGDTTIDVNFPGPWLIDPKQPGGVHVSGFWAGALVANDFRFTFDKLTEGKLLPTVTGNIPINAGTCIQVHNVPILGTEDLIGCR